MTDFALYGSGAAAGGAFWSSRVYATGVISEAAAATAISDAWGDLWGHITTYLPPVTTLTQTKAVTLDPATWKFSTASSTDEASEGTSTDMSLPVGLAAVITWRTTSVAKGSTGRSFLPPAAVNAVATATDSGLLLPAFQTACTAGASAFQTALAGAGLTMVKLRRSNLSTLTITLPQTGAKFRRQFRRGDKSANSYV